MTINSLTLPPAEPTVTLRQSARWAWRVLWRGKLLVGAVVALAVAPTVLVLKQTPPRYTATAQIMVEAPETNDVLDDRGATASRSRMTESVMQTEAELIASSMLARRAVEKLGLDKDPEFNAKLREPSGLSLLLASVRPEQWLPESWRSEAGETEADALSPAARQDIEMARIVRAFSGRLTVRAPRRSHIITLQFVSESREKAALIANTVAELYVLDRLEASFDEARRVTGWLGERLEALRQDVVAAEGAVEQYRSQFNLNRKNERQATIGEQQLSELSSRLVIARAELAQKQARLDQVRSLTRTRGSVETSSDVLQSPLIQRLREQEATKSREMSEATKIYGERHPRIVGLRAELDDVRRRIADEVNKVAVSIANEVEVAAAGVGSLQSELEASRRQTTVAGAAEVRLRELERQADASRSLYEAFLARFKREAEQERMQRANARIVSAADVPVVASYPATRQTIALAALVSLLAGIGIVFLLDRLDNAVRSSDESEELTGMPTLAMIPMQRGASDDPVKEMAERARSPLADGVRSLRTALHLAAEPNGGSGRAVLITSSVPKEGKSFVSLYLSLLFSKSHDRVLLIDGDVHRPRLHKALGVEGGVGLAQVLKDEAAFDDVVRRGIGGSLDFLPAGHCEDLAEVVQPERAAALLEMLKSRYALIVIDSPPALAVADTRILARLADHVVYLVRWNATPRDAVRNGVKLLRGAGVRLSGIVLSQVNQRKHSKYGYGDYGQYYGRYRQYYGG